MMEKDKVESAKLLHEKLCELIQVLRMSVQDREHSLTLRCWKSMNEELRIGLDVWRAAIGSISSTATKLGLVLADPSLCREATDQCEQLATACYVISKSGAGAPLNELVSTATLQVLTAMRGLVECLISNSRTVDAPPKAGIVWEACDVALKCPRSNRAAFHRKILAWCCELKDSIEEFRRVLLEEDVDDEESSTAQGQEDQFTDDLFFFGKENYTEIERQNMQKLLAVLHAVGRTLQCTLIELDDAGTNGDFDRIVLCFTQAERIHQVAALISEELYPPLEMKTLALRMHTLLSDLDRFDIAEANVLELCRTRINIVLCDLPCVSTSS